MATNASRPTQTPAGKTPLPTKPPVATRQTAGLPLESGADTVVKVAGYGLPCAKCRLYYPADLDICPTCHHHERVSPVVPRVEKKLAQSVPDPVPDSAVVEQEREEFLRQFKSQLMEAHAGVVNASGAACLLSEHRGGDDAGAVACKACYERLQERVDVCEAALHMDAKEAAQIIYDAVWADPSDPSKTYENAANALLAEIRKRGGMNSLMGPFRPLSD